MDVLIGIIVLLGIVGAAFALAVIAMSIMTGYSDGERAVKMNFYTNKKEFRPDEEYDNNFWRPWAWVYDAVFKRVSERVWYAYNNPSMTRKERNLARYKARTEKPATQLEITDSTLLKGN